MEKLKLKVGDKLFVLIRGGRGKPQSAKYHPIVKVGRKFFYVEGLSEGISLDISFPINYNYYVAIYRSKEEWEDAEYRRNFVQNLNCITRSKLHDIPLEKLKEVAEILELEIKEG